MNDEKKPLGPVFVKAVGYNGAEKDINIANISALMSSAAGSYFNSQGRARFKDMGISDGTDVLLLVGAESGAVIGVSPAEAKEKLKKLGVEFADLRNG